MQRTRLWSRIQTLPKLFRWPHFFVKTMSCLGNGEKMFVHSNTLTICLSKKLAKLPNLKLIHFLLHVHMPLLQNHTLKNEYLLLKHRHKCGPHTQTDCFVQTKLIVRSVPPTFPNTEDKGMPVNILRLFMFLLLEQQHLYLLQVTRSLLGLQFHPWMWHKPGARVSSQHSQCATSREKIHSKRPVAKTR